MPHIHDLIDFTIVAYIVCNNRILLIHHKKLNKWLPIGGHIELDEDPEQALYREIAEECGLEVELMSSKPSEQHNNGKYLCAPNYMDIHSISDTHKHVGIIYFLKTEDDKVTLEEHSHNDIKWFTLDEMKRPEFAVQSDVIFCSKKALEEYNKLEV